MVAMQAKSEKATSVCIFEYTCWIGCLHISRAYFWFFFWIFPMYIIKFGKIEACHNICTCIKNVIHSNMHIDVSLFPFSIFPFQIHIHFPSCQISKCLQLLKQAQFKLRASGFLDTLRMSNFPISAISRLSKIYQVKCTPRF